MQKILIVDDEHMMLMLAKRVLSEKYELVTASDGNEAVEIFDKEAPDMLLTDLFMPGMSGSELKEELRRRSGRNIPTLYMTGAVDEGEIDGEYIIKPLDAEELLRKVEKVMKGAPDKFTEVCASGNGALMLIELVGSGASESAVVLEPRNNQG